MGKILPTIAILICTFSKLLAEDQLILFTGNAHSELAKTIADYLKMPLGAALVGEFNDGEVQIQIEESVRGKDVFIVQSSCKTADKSVNDNLMELYLLIRTAKRASAKSITAVIPYYGYARQDRKTTSRVPISAADVALMLETAGIDRLLTIDLHCGQIQGFFHDIPVDNLFASPIFVTQIAQKKDLENIVVVSPDAGGVARAKNFAESLNKQGFDVDIALISKERAKAGVVASMNLIGNVQGADAIIVDDLCDTGGTLVKSAQLLKDLGARRVFAVITHPVFSKDALEKIGNSVIDEMLISDSIPLRGNTPDNIRLVSIAPLLGEAIQRTHQGKSVSVLFD